MSTNIRMIEAAKQSDERKIRLLVAAGDDVNCETPGRETPLHYASARGCVDVIRALIAFGAKIHARDSYGCTPILWAAEAGKMSSVKFIARHYKNDKFETDFIGKTPLHYAALSGDYETVRYFLKRSENINAQTERGDTAMHFAVKNRKPDIVKLLLDAGAEFVIANKNGESPLHLAVDSDNGEIIEMMMARVYRTSV